ncbi:MAG TPA: hypothetical protein VFF78_00315 [Anaerolineaceae bacterium]|nr:hypothetical protein [Anaerolineaceae bacterium]
MRKIHVICVICIIAVLSSACNLPITTPTPAPPKETFTPNITFTPEIIITPTYPCPLPTQERPPMVSPVTSPTNETTQEIYISGNFESAVIRTESGEFASSPDSGPLKVVVTLLPNTIHHLTVTAQVRLNTWHNCSYGGYTMTTVTDSEGNPLTIVQGVPATPSASTEVISPKNINQLTRLGSLDSKTMMNGFLFAGEFELLTFGYNQPNTRWSLPALARVGTIGPDEPQFPGAVSADYFPKEIPTRLALGGAGNPGGEEQFSVKIWNLKDDSVQLVGNHGGSVSAIAFSPSGKYVASAANDDLVQVHLADGSGLQSEFRSGRQNVMESFYCMHWTDDQTLWVGGNQSIYKLNAVDGSLMQSILVDGNYACDFSADGRWFAATNQEVPMKLVDLQSGKLEYLLPYAPDQYPGYLVDATFSPDGSLVAAINYTGMWFVWDTASGELLLQQAASLSDGYHIRFSPEGHYLAVSGWQSPVVELWGIP